MHAIRRILIGLPVAFGLIACTSSASATDFGIQYTTPVSIKTTLNSLYDSERIPGGRFGYLVMDAHTGEVLKASNEDELFIPASLAKIPTTVVALATYGGERQFDTRIIADGIIVDGTLEGDLHLVGGGDPSLRTQDLWNLANGIANSGIQRITGRFTYYTGALPEAAQIDRAQPPGQHYNPAVGGLNIDYNMRRRNGRRLPVTRPGLRTAKMLRKMASTKGVSLAEPTRSDIEPVGMEIALHRSAPVSTIAKRMLDRSTNLTAEVLGAASAGTFGLRPHSLGAAAKMTSEWIKTEVGPISGTGWDGFTLANHSGLSTQSRVTPRQMAEILRFGYQRFGEPFVQLHRNDSPGGRRAFSIRAKIGSMRFVRGYGGFLNVGGREMIFTIMSNDNYRRAAADAGQTQLGGKRWMAKAKQLEKALLTDWISAYWPKTAGL